MEGYYVVWTDPQETSFHYHGWYPTLEKAEKTMRKLGDGLCVGRVPVVWTGTHYHEVCLTLDKVQ